MNRIRQKPWHRRCKECNVLMRTLSGSKPDTCGKCYMEYKRKQRSK